MYKEAPRLSPCPPHSHPFNLATTRWHTQVRPHVIVALSANVGPEYTEHIKDVGVRRTTASTATLKCLVSYIERSATLQRGERD